MAYKVFTNGSVLQASEVNENLMQQAVATFSNAAARTAAITSPVEGQMTYLLDVDRYEHWNGSSWISPFGMTLLASASPSASTEVIFNNVFSSSYQTYKIYYNLSGSASTGLNSRLRSSGTDVTTNYAWQFFEAINTAIAGGRDTSSGLFNFGAIRTSGRSFGFIEISNPFAVAETSYVCLAQDPLGLASIQIRSGGQFNSTSYDGLRIYPSSGNITGSIRIYGVRN